MKKFEQINFVPKKLTPNDKNSLEINEVDISIQKENTSKKHVQNNAKNTLKETQQDHDDNIKHKELRFKFAAIVLDRFFFYLALFYALITFVGLLLSIPNFYNS
jgi:hypothetical protein